MVTFEKVGFAYPAATEDSPAAPVLCDITLTIARGEFVAIAGHNGSGKSTLARHINALLLPLGGTVYVDGKNTLDSDALWEIRKTAAMVFQNPDNQLVAATVEEDVAFGPENLGVPSEEIRARVAEALETVGMADYARRPPHRLSGGQKQRVAIAGGFAMRPQLIILDEPTAMLDPAGRREVLDTMRCLNRAGMTVVLITHDMDEAAAASRLIVMDNGRIVLDGPPRSVFAHGDILAQRGLTLPYPAALAHRLRAGGFPVGEVLTADELMTDSAFQAACADPQSRERVIAFITDTPGCAERHFTGAAPGEAPLAPGEAPAPLPAIEVRRLTHIYAAGTAFEKKALDDLSLTIYDKEKVAFIGRTGSGKSTLIQHFNGLLSPTSGEVLVNDTPPGGKKSTPTRRVGMVFQQPEHQLFEATVYKDVAFAPSRLGITGAALDKRVREALNAVCLPESTWDMSPFALSGGQKRRAAIAGVVAMAPPILVLDEPTAGLDPRAREDMLCLIDDMHRRLGLTVIIISHAMDDIARLCNRIFVINGGKIIASGTPGDIFSRRAMLRENDLAAPQGYELLARVREAAL